jgi:hypothetical protein
MMHACILVCFNDNCIKTNPYSYPYPYIIMYVMCASSIYLYDVQAGVLGVVAIGVHFYIHGDKCLQLTMRKDRDAPPPQEDSTTTSATATTSASSTEVDSDSISSPLI